MFATAWARSHSAVLTPLIHKANILTAEKPISDFTLFGKIFITVSDWIHLNPPGFPFCIYLILKILLLGKCAAPNIKKQMVRVYILTDFCCLHVSLIDSSFSHKALRTAVVSEHFLLLISLQFIANLILRHQGWPQTAYSDHFCHATTSPQGFSASFQHNRLKNMQ